MKGITVSRGGTVFISGIGGDLREREREREKDRSPSR